MKIYIWKGKGISAGYHDDGTLIVLAESPEQARELAKAERAEAAAIREEWHAAVDAMHDPYADGGLVGWWPEDRIRHDWDGSDEAIDREPDRVVDLDVATVVAFNGGGYD